VQRARERGFTIVEVMVATAIMLVAALSLGAVLTNATSAVALSQQSQQASELASSVIAETEALSWATLSSGLDNNAASDPYFAGDSNISATGSAPGNQCFEGMPLVVNGLAPATCPSGSSQGGPSYPWQGVSGPSCASSLSSGLSGSTTLPLVPHQSCVTLSGGGSGGNSFQIAVYPTLVSGSSVSATGAQIEVTAVVAWANGGAGTSTGRTRVTDTVVLTDCGTGGPRCA
jgi:prepilin-type N-terminal cleavage/methylation domain-containing protein